MKNLITEQPIDKHLKPVKDTDNNISSLEISTEKVRVKDLEVTGTTTGVSVPSSPIIRDVKASGFNYSSTAPTRVFIELSPKLTALPKFANFTTSISDTW